jgi:hypothetical protein
MHLVEIEKTTAADQMVIKVLTPMAVSREITLMLHNIDKPRGNFKERI